ncbi:3'-5' exonuclease [Runella sp. SP2]|uniref:3'-5' exonuclease n=1 Tax=Runella sp. SP2 TaxID=2268026 RepID=UPI000F08962C|nr:3'-5' exonuclease [Runella sp. SP2]AYQ31466.1 3'-5' exonuclease [Runella sp. SP2]
MQKYCILDTETTGTSESSELLSIAIINQNGKTLLDTYVTPTKEKEWPNATKINGITPKFIFEGNFPTLETLNPSIVTVLKQYKNVVMYGADYDSRFIESALSIAKPKVHCCMARFSQYMGIWDETRGIWKRHKLTYAAELVGHDWTGSPHGALSDAQATLSVWNYLESTGAAIVL